MRIALIADIHANLPALEACLAAAERLNEELAATIEELTEENIRLQRDIAVFSASSALS